ncbi:hypothetical protein P5G51_019400 [Virgibacillus sp. 179-BFC.A HS]|uniref:DUF8208 domain-containing protein n=1 Tax=Tigheibacillus jepli TaxID=3035914 RepID=A0ABU5CLG5_9BACI|nr:hypothetical protein [Virgibacillus sp. 179-BFC.A HS]MDY0407208.1 hypothetical protein [Virgibacillus sp. 179-BFC.A HS]
MLKRNVADLKYYLDSNFNYADGLNKDTVMGDENTLPHPPHPTNKEIGTSNYYYANKLNNPDLIDVTEKLDIYEDEGWFSWTTEDWVKELTNDEKEFLKHTLVQNGDGTSRIEKLSENTVPATNLGQQSYYRYHVNWAIAITILAVTGFALIITTLKIGRAMFDLAFHQIYAMFTASTDITGGQRLKKVLTEIVSTFAVIFVMIVLLKLFIIYAQWANDLEQEIGIVGVIILLIAGAWALIDAPDIVQRTMGIDAGLRSGWQAMMGAYAGTKMAGAGASMVGKGAGKVVKTGGKTAGGIGAGGVGAYKGMKDGMRNNNVKPVPPRDQNQGKSRNERQFSTNTVNNPNVMEPKKVHQQTEKILYQQSQTQVFQVVLVIRLQVLFLSKQVMCLLEMVLGDHLQPVSINQLLTKVVKDIFTLNENTRYLVEIVLYNVQVIFFHEHIIQVMILDKN